MGGRPKGIGDYIELIVARVLGRNLTPIQGCIVQLVAIIIVVGSFWLLLSSGTFMQLVEPVARWYAEQALPHPTPTTLPR